MKKQAKYWMELNGVVVPVEVVFRDRLTVLVDLNYGGKGRLCMTTSDWKRKQPGKRRFYLDRKAALRAALPYSRQRLNMLLVIRRSDARQLRDDIKATRKTIRDQEKELGEDGGEG